VIFTCACLLLPLGEIKIIASVSSLGILTVFTAVQVAVIRLRYTHPDVKRPFKLPFAVGRMPVLPVITLIMLLILMTQFESLVYLIAGGVIGTCISVYFIRQRFVAR
jgi:APA family basic amino acid/polyamine antiporter